ncbi:membrane protein, partial [Rhodococcus rhodochrous]
MSDGRARALGWTAAALAVCLLAGLLLGTTRGVSDGAELRVSDSARLSDLVRAAQAKADELAATRDDLAGRVAELQAQAAATDDD